MTADAILNWAANTGLSVSILIVLVLLVRKPVTKFAGAGAAYALWLLPLIRFVMPALPVLPTSPPATPVSVPHETVTYLSTAPDMAAQDFNWSFWLVFIWMSGAVLWLFVQAYRQIRFTRVHRQSTGPVSPEVDAVLQDLSKRLGLRRVPELIHSASSTGPILTGLLRPVIILPDSFDETYSREQQNYALAHELSHIKNRDLWAAAGAVLFRAVNWPNPLVHIAAAKFRADQEAACDARVIKLMGGTQSIRTNYADTLVNAARLSVYPAQPMPLGLTISNPLKERLMILKSNPRNSRGFRLALMGVSALALMATAPLTAAQSTPTPPDTPELAGKSVDKQVMKWVTNENGVETKKHIEIITEDGVTTAWEIDEIGNRFQVPVDSLDMPMGITGSRVGKIHVMMEKMDEGNHLSHEEIIAMIEEDMEGVDIDELAGASGQRRVIVKRMGPDGDLITEDIFGGDVDINVEQFIDDNGDGKKVIIMENHSGFDITSDGENSFVFHSGGMTKSQPGIMVEAASGMLEGIDTSDLDRDARRKIEKAQKALKDAQQALADAN